MSASRLTSSESISKWYSGLSLCLYMPPSSEVFWALHTNAFIEGYAVFSWIIVSTRVCSLIFMLVFIIIHTHHFFNNKKKSLLNLNNTLSLVLHTKREITMILKFFHKCTAWSQNSSLSVLYVKNSLKIHVIVLGGVSKPTAYACILSLRLTGCCTYKTCEDHSLFC